MKLLKLLFLTLIPLPMFAANPAFTDFNNTQFAVPGNKVSIKDGVAFTNGVAQTTFTVNSTNSATHFGGSADATNGFLLRIKFVDATNYAANGTFDCYVGTGTNQLFTLPNGTNGFITDGRVYTIASGTNNGSIIVTNANGVQLIAGQQSIVIPGGQSSTFAWSAAIGQWIGASLTGLLSGNNVWTGSNNFNIVTASSLSITGAVFHSPLVWTNDASGNWGMIQATPTNTMVYNIGTNGGGGFNTNIFTLGNGITSNEFRFFNSVNQQVLVVQTNGAVQIGTNQQVTIDASGNLATPNGSVQATNLVLDPYTIATLPTPSGSTFPLVYASDVITPRGTGGLVRWDGSNWRILDGIVATADIKTFILNSYGYTVNSPLGQIESCLNPIAQNGVGVFTPPIPLTGSGTGAGSSVGVNVGSIGVYGPAIDIATGSTATGGERLWGPPQRQATAGDYFATAGIISYDVNCTAADAYFTWIGFGSAANSVGVPATGAYFLYDMYTNSTTVIPGAGISKTNNWICVAANGGSYQFVDSGLPVSTNGTVGIGSGANRLMIISTSTAVYFYTNGVLSQTLASQIPAAALYGAYFNICKTNGTTPRHMYIAAPNIHVRYSAGATLP